MYFWLRSPRGPFLLLFFFAHVCVIYLCMYTCVLVRARVHIELEADVFLHCSPLYLLEFLLQWTSLNPQLQYSELLGLGFRPSPQFIGQELFHRAPPPPVLLWVPLSLLWPIFCLLSILKKIVDLLSLCNLACCTSEGASWGSHPQWSIPHLYTRCSAGLGCSYSVITFVLLFSFCSWCKRGDTNKLVFQEASLAGGCRERRKAEMCQP